MATSAVVGPAVFRQSWQSTNHRFDELQNYRFTASPNMPRTGEPAGHHRSYSEVQHNSERPRLPPISNFLSRMDRPDPTLQPTFHDQPSIGPRSNGAPVRQDSLSSPTHLHQQAWTPINEGHKHVAYFDAIHRSPNADVVRTDYVNHERQRRASMNIQPASHSATQISSGYPMPATPREVLNSTVPLVAKVMVREDVFDGKECYVYDDGSYVPKSINGDMVNPKWGTTKAGKPRKRLGQACNACREKKIKCDPSSQSRCTQCEKFGRECIFEAPTRPGHKSPRSQASGGSPTASYILDDTTRMRRSSVAATEASIQSDSGRTSTPKAAFTPESALLYRVPETIPGSHSPTPTKRARLNPQYSGPSSMFSLDVDPFQANKDLTMMYARAYFANINTSTFGMLPETLFMRWMEKDTHKCSSSKLVIYCILVMGCRFAKHPDKVSHERILAEVALQGMMQPISQFSLQLVHARLIFALYEFQNGREQAGWDLEGAAMRAACAMNLNTESGVAQASRKQETVYGLTQGRLSECMRRTFWIAFVMDRFAAASLGFPTMFDRSSLYLRLPCTDRDYLSGLVPETQVFDGEEGTILSTSREELSRLSSLAFLAQISSLICEIHILATKAKHQAALHKGERYKSLRTNLSLQLRTWDQEYTTFLGLQDANNTHIPQSSSNMTGGLHIIYHHACMVLHRYVHHSVLTPREITHHAQEAHRHACRTLEIAQQLDSKNAPEIPDYNIGATGALAGYAIVAAIDIVTAAGLNSDVLENDGRLMRLMMSGAVPLLDRLAQHWTSAKRQSELVLNRTKLLCGTLMGGAAERKTAFFITEPIAKVFGEEDDLVYGVDRIQYVKAMGWASSIRDRFDMIEIGRGNSK